ncbi:hypothetical protein PLESTB_001102800 [Pleodorina starrii]|uniref:F-box domain-containing protein n=1 Tax=Pleodorina starrii TaxID=330485 RepID=A0A9W6BQG3_9CHLO|nr:hypothetical protein PLESTB_001102800 [Pleodorina starrii]
MRAQPDYTEPQQASPQITTTATTATTAPEPIALLPSLPDGVLARIVQATDPDARRQLRLVSRALRPLVDASTPSLTLSSYSLPCLAARGRLPEFAPQLRNLLLELQDTTAPAAFLARLPRLGLSQLPRLASVSLALAHDHLLPPAALADLAAALPPSTTRLTLTHMLGSPTPRQQPPPPPPQQRQLGQGGGGRAAAAAAGGSSHLDLSALRHLLLLCPQVREIRLEGGCWVRSAADMRALAGLAAGPAVVAAAAADDAAASGGGVVISSIRGLYLDAAVGHLDLAGTLAALSGLAALEVQLDATAVRQAPPVAAAGDDAAAGGGGGGMGGLLAEVAAAALNQAHIDLVSEQLLRGLAAPALAGLTRLVVREFQGSATALLGALEGLPLLAHLGLSGLDDAPYIKDTHLELLARLPSLTHLAVDRLDISSPSLAQPYQHQYHDQSQQQQQQQQQCPGSVSEASGSFFPGLRGDAGGGGGGILPGLTGLEVNLVVHSVPRLPHVFPSVRQLTLRWLWEQAMRKLAGWTSLTSLSLANLDCCLDWGLVRTLTGLTQLQLCRGSSYEQLAELLYLLRALPGLRLLRLSGWHCMRQSEPGRMAMGLTRGILGAGAGAEAGAGAVGGSAGGGGDGIDSGGSGGMAEAVGGGEGVPRVAAAPQQQQQQQQQGDSCEGSRAAAEQTGRRAGTPASAAVDSSSSCPRSARVLAPPATAAAAQPHPAAASSYLSSSPSPSPSPSSASASSSAAAAAMAAAFAALDPDLHRAWGRIRVAPDATAAAGAAMSLLRCLPRLRSLELHDCGHPLLRGLASRALLEDGGPLGGLGELRLCRLVDVMGGDVEEAAAALPGLRRLGVYGCWPVDGEALLRLEGLRRAGVDVVWRR